MTGYFKILCLIIALILVPFNYDRDNPITALYWSSVALYWLFNIIGG